MQHKICLTWAKTSTSIDAARVDPRVELPELTPPPSATAPWPPLYEARHPRPSQANPAPMANVLREGPRFSVAPRSGAPRNGLPLSCCAGHTAVSKSATPSPPCSIAWSPATPASRAWVGAMAGEGALTAAGPVGGGALTLNCKSAPKDFPCNLPAERAPMRKLVPGCWRCRRCGRRLAIGPPGRQGCSVPRFWEDGCRGRPLCVMWTLSGCGPDGPRWMGTPSRGWVYGFGVRLGPTGVRWTGVSARGRGRQPHTS